MMKKFDEWWNSIYADRPKMIHRQCYEEGYEQGRAEVKGAVAIGFSVVTVLLLLIWSFYAWLSWSNT